MERIKYNYQFNLIKNAINLLPVKIKPYLETVDFVFDYNPYYIGFNPPNKSKDGRRYIDTCHHVFSWNTPDKKRTIFLFSKDLENYNESLDIIWHEVAHAIHEQLKHCNYNWIPLCNYEENFHEVFACSFTRWLYPNRNKDLWGGNQELQRKYDKRPIEFFNNLFGVKK